MRRVWVAAKKKQNSDNVSGEWVSWSGFRVFVMQVMCSGGQEGQLIFKSRSSLVHNTQNVGSWECGVESLLPKARSVVIGRQIVGFGGSCPS
ncbi:hypothetical protein HYQ46_006217 [Verticillium longisporum]|nr:hypothetical protein HYQ46_006217 [Verticillium longisporum]